MANINETEKYIQEYKKWFEKNNKKTGGLILQATAARLLNTPKQNINRMVKTGKLAIYQFDLESEKYIGMDQVEEIIQSKIKRAKTTQEHLFFGDNKQMEIKESADVTQIKDNSPDEWAEEWIINNPDTSFSSFIDKKIKEWKNKHKNITPKFDIRKEKYRRIIYILENDKKQLKYARLIFINGKFEEFNETEAHETTILY